MATLAAGLLAVAGCTFESSLQGVRCADDGTRSHGRVCKNGHWLEVSEDAGDTQIATDASADAARDAHVVDHDDPDASIQDIGADAPPCPDGLTRCGHACVDTQVHPSHCGACHTTCIDNGRRETAQCIGGVCERICAQGWSDTNNDWVGTTGEVASSDGCEFACTPTDDPTEVCDGVDNDCNGEIDEGLATSTYLLDADADGFGVDGESRELCAPLGRYSAAEGGDCNDSDPAVHPDAEEICNGIDDDCDGTPDPECDCTNGDTMSCYSGPNNTLDKGLCTAGTSTCAAGSWGVCQGEVTPAAEGCDGLDNDCDAEVDEGVELRFEADTDGDGFGDPGDTVSACSAPSGYVAAGGQADCDDQDPTSYPGADELCDGRDNDCDASSDDYKTTATNTWCVDTFGDNALECDDDGANGELCCEASGDSDGCDFESVCHNGVDEDSDGDTDCADADCDGMYCAPGKSCQSGGCQAN